MPYRKPGWGSFQMGWDSPIKSVLYGTTKVRFDRVLRMVSVVEHRTTRTKFYDNDDRLIRLVLFILLILPAGWKIRGNGVSNEYYIYRVTEIVLSSYRAS